jgi:hypothetical protein
MSYSLRVEGGDLVVGNKRALEVVTGKEKLFQDLKLWLLERVGTDPSTPTFGSRLDGGVVDGQIIPSNEVLHTINEIDVRQMATTILVRVNISTMDNTTFNLTIPLAV